MPKKCIICESEAEFCVKGSSESYCKSCAQEQFGDLDLLVSVEEHVRNIKSQVDELLEQEETN